MSTAGSSAGSGSTVVTSSAAPPMRFARERADERILVDQLAAADIDEQRVRLHAGELGVAEQADGVGLDRQAQYHRVSVAAAPRAVARG